MSASSPPVLPTKRKILVTSALPYANGDIHIGHLVEYVQTDIWVRFLRMQNHEAYYVCADDTHGTAIMLKAQKEGIAPEALIDRVWQEHTRDFSAFHIGFDIYHSTHSPENKQLSTLFYTRLRDAGLITEKEIEQAYDEVLNIFLPDRFIKGTCPKCKAHEQYGDACEVCGTTYAPTELLDAYSVLSNTAPILKKSLHYFFALSKPECLHFLRTWVQRLEQSAIVNKLKEWLDADALQDWDISRDAPYFGFEIPDAPGKFFYVWLDAPVGYYAAFTALAEKNHLNIADWLHQDASAELYHFIGKDIVYFHTLFWPSMLHFAQFKTPNNVFAHGFLTVNGQKMSKSRGTFITAKSYIEANIDANYLRYYFASKLSNQVEDIDLNLDDFIQKINSDLVGKFINLASRSSGFITKKFHSKLSHQFYDHDLIAQIRNKNHLIAKLYEDREYGKVVRCIMECVDTVNAYIDQEKPWSLKNDEDQPTLHAMVSLIILCFKTIAIYLKPIVPELTKKIEVFLNIESQKWEDVYKDFPNNHTIQAYTHLLTRIEDSAIKTMLEKNIA